MKEVDLNKESAMAGSHFLASSGAKTLPLKDQQDLVNHVATGFFMGVRWHEQQMGVKNDGK